MPLIIPYLSLYPGDTQVKIIGKNEDRAPMGTGSQGLSEIAMPCQFLSMYANLDEFSSCENRKVM